MRAGPGPTAGQKILPKPAKKRAGRAGHPKKLTKRAYFPCPKPAQKPKKFGPGRARPDCGPKNEAQTRHFLRAGRAGPSGRATFDQVYFLSLVFIPLLARLAWFETNKINDRRVRRKVRKLNTQTKIANHNFFSTVTTNVPVVNVTKVR